MDPMTDLSHQRESHAGSHFDDPRSTTCEVTVEGAARLEPQDQVELYCRTRLVVTEWSYAAEP